MSARLIDIAVKLHAETAMAILVSDDGDPSRAVWLLKSQIEIQPTKHIGILEITLPEWLAQDKKLI